MKSVCFKLVLVLCLFSMISCSSESNDKASDETVNSEKRLTKIVYEFFENNSKVVRNIEYDSQGRIIFMTDDFGNKIETYQYNATGKLSKNEFFDYDSETNVLENKEVTEFLYNADNKISDVIETYSYYDTSGNFISENSVSSKVTYSGNKMIRLDENRDYKTEYQFNNSGLIDLVKVFRGDILKSNMSFIYDADGNCISGSGPIDEGSLDTTTSNINLSVTYSEEEKHPFFNQFFEYQILSSGQGFYNLKNILVNQQGNKFAKEIEWYQYNDHTYKEIYNNSFDKNNYLTSALLSELPNYLDYGSITYVWE